MGTRIYVGNLPFDATEEQLRALYEDLATRGTLIFGEDERIDDPGFR